MRGPPRQRHAVAARKRENVVAAVNFARENRLRLVVKGGGHSYQGTSNSADSLLVWTRAMDEIALHDAFVGKDCAGRQTPQSAVSIGAGAIWMHVYDAVTTKAGRYVQGGGCATVGVAGLIQSGGFGSFSKNYGLPQRVCWKPKSSLRMARCALPMRARIPSCSGASGGGGGSLGIVTRVTLKTRELPDYFGGVFATIRAASDAAYRRLIGQFIRLYSDSLFNRHWGEQASFSPGNTLRIAMVFQGLSQQQAAEVWRPFLDGVAASPQDFTLASQPIIVALPARHFWDPTTLESCRES
jgi:FAD/FMN-containing dehydrogenase